VIATAVDPDRVQGIVKTALTVSVHGRGQETGIERIGTVRIRTGIAKTEIKIKIRTEKREAQTREISLLKNLIR